MEKVIVIYDEHYNDVDVLGIPSKIVKNIIDLGKMYCEWLYSHHNDPQFCTVVNGVKCTILETEGFVNWLNFTVLKDDAEKATILETNVQFREGYPIVEF